MCWRRYVSGRRCVCCHRCSSLPEPHSCLLVDHLAVGGLGAKWCWAGTGGRAPSAVHRRTGAALRGALAVHSDFGGQGLLIFDGRCRRGSIFRVGASQSRGFTVIENSLIEKAPSQAWRS